MLLFVERIIPYSIALLAALLTLMQWCAWRYRFAIRYRRLLGAAMSPRWYVNRQRSALQVIAAHPQSKTEAEAESDATEIRAAS